MENIGTSRTSGTSGTTQNLKAKTAFGIKTQYAIALTITAYFIIRCGVSAVFNV